MRELTELRAELDSLDREIVACFEKRMAISRDVAAWKIAHDKPVLDASREAQVLDARAAMLQDPALTDSVRALFTEIMRLSREEQQKLMK